MMDGRLEMEPTPSPSAGGWDQWGLGDLADVARWAAEVLGSATVVRRVSIVPPSDQAGAPRVIAVVHDEQTLALLAERAIAQEQSPRLYDDRFGTGWFIEVDGIEFHAQAEVEAWR